MELTKLPFPDVSNRRQVTPFNLHRGSVVAFKTNDCEQRTGIIVMNNDHEMLVAYNLYKEPGNIWTEGILPNHVFLYEANEEEKRAGYLLFFEENFDKNLGLADRILKFVSREVRGRGYFSSREYGYRSTELFSFIPQFLNDQQRVEVLKSVREKVLASGGVQFDRHQAEGECFLLAVLMIYNSVKDESKRHFLINLLQDKWSCIVIMYGICMGHVLGSNFTNIVGVLNNLKNPEYVGYIHLYLPIAERCFDKCCAYYDNKIKLRNAITILSKLENSHEQKTDLDELYGILFPNCYLEAMSKSRPAATIAGMQQEIAEKNRRIKELENNVLDFNKRYESLLHDFEALAKTSVSFDEIEKGLLILTRGLAEQVLLHLSFTLPENEELRKQMPRLMRAIKENDKSGAEIHNHFGENSHCQIFNGPTSGQFGNI